MIPKRNPVLEVSDDDGVMGQFQQLCLFLQRFCRLDQFGGALQDAILQLVVQFLERLLCVRALGKFKLCLRQQMPFALRSFPAKACHGKMSSYSGQEFTRSEGLNQIIVGSLLEAFYPRFLACTRRKQNHRFTRGRGILTDQAENPEAVEAGHHHIR